MSYIDRINACNNYNPAHFRPFFVDGVQVGSLKHGFAQHLSPWPDIFQVSADAVLLSNRLDSFDERTRAVALVTEALVDRGIIDRRHGERYPVTCSTRDRGLLLLDRGAVPYFGIRAFGQHMNGFIHTDTGLKMWLARRSMDKANAPGKLDNMVAGGLPHDLSLEENLAKECWEEAAIPAQLAAQAVPVGFISYCADSPRGLKPDVMYCYDLELPVDFEPYCTDGEVEGFQLYPVEEVAELVAETTEIKKNCNLVIIDFLIRRGYIGGNYPEYLDLVTGLRRKMPIGQKRVE